MGTVEHEAAIYAKLHANRFEHIDQARRSRELQANMVRLREAQSKRDAGFTRIILGLSALLVINLAIRLIWGA